ncbi:MAG: lysylphosphatidylglycerol synthase domain-containing protein, partial [Candidatus Saccharimonadales bacterium]
MIKGAATKKVIKYCAVIGIIAATFIFFGFYIHGHPELITTLADLNFLTLLLLTVGYVSVTVTNAFVLLYSLRLIKKRTPIIDNIILTGYSSIVNFFGPLQSGPGFRAIYLKKKYGVKLRAFFVTTLIFYGFFGIINAAIIAISSANTFGSTPFYITAIVSLITLGVAAIYAATRIKRIQAILVSVKLNDKNFWLIGLGAAMVSLITAAIYFIEIQHINADISVTQVIVYTAAANLSLFVSLTPGAIGIRESFLVLSQQLHGIDTSTIVGASVIDRAFYV